MRWCDTITHWYVGWYSWITFWSNWNCEKIGHSYMIFLYKTGKFYPAMLANHLMKSCTPFGTPDPLSRPWRKQEVHSTEASPKATGASFVECTQRKKSFITKWFLFAHNCIYCNSFFQFFGEKLTRPNGGNSPPGKTQLPYKTKKCQKSLELTRNLNTNWCHWFKEVLSYRLNPPDWRKKHWKKCFFVRPEKWTLSAVPMQNCKATALVAPQSITFVF